MNSSGETRMSSSRKTILVKRLGLGALVAVWAISCCTRMYWVTPSRNRSFGLSRGCFFVHRNYSTGRTNHLPASQSVFGLELTLCLREWLSVSVGWPRPIEPRWLPAFDKTWSRSFTLMATTFAIPLYIPLLPFVALRLRRILQMRWRRGRIRHGLCGECGYDLRASPEKCPECGDKPESAPSLVEGGNGT